MEKLRWVTARRPKRFVLQRSSMAATLRRVRRLWPTLTVWAFRLRWPELFDGATGAYSDGDLDGTTIQVDSGTGGSFQVGPTDSAFNRIEVNVGDMTATGSKLNLSSAGVASISDARSSITTIDLAITEVAAERGNLGAFQNRLSFTIAYTENEIENIQASEASISDADVAAEVTQFTQAQILSQASTAMLAQANVIPQNALALLQ